MLDSLKIDFDDNKRVKMITNEFIKCIVSS